MAEILSGFELVTWNTIASPAVLPSPVVARIGAVTHQALRDPQLIRVLTDLGAEPWPTTLEEASATRAAQERAMAALVQVSRARLE